MSIDLINKTKGVLIIPIDWENYEFFFEVTSKGLEIDGNLITWEWLDEARKHLNEGK